MNDEGFAARGGVEGGADETIDAHPERFRSLEPEVRGRPGRVVATVASCGIYSLWWMYDLQVEGDRHLEANWAWEDSLAGVVSGTA